MLILLAGSRGGGVGSVNTPEPQNYALEITYPKAIAAQPSGLDADNRCYFAYTGLTYEIPLCSVGGRFPNTWSVSNAPAGMSVQSYTTRAGNTAYKLVWTNPTSSATDITVTCRDAVGTEVSETFSITVGTTGWYFVDAVNGNAHSTNGGTGTGTLANPWLTIDDVYDGAGASTRVYFRTGTYTLANLPVVTGGTPVDDRVAISETSRPVIWLNYPSESPVINFESAHLTTSYRPAIRFTGDNICVSGFEIRDPHNKCLWMDRTNQRGLMIWENYFHDIGPGLDGSNSAFIMHTRNDGLPSYGICIVSNRFSQVINGTGSSALKFYGTLKLLCEENAFDNSDSSETLALKDENQQFTVRRNKAIDTISDVAFGGNFHGTTAGFEPYGEFCYNNVNATVDALRLNQDSQILTIHSYRNTYRGRIYIHENTNAGDGPMNFRHDVMQNAAGGITFGDAGDEALGVVVETDNLKGTSGLVDASGNLTGANTVYIGTRGYQIP